MTPEMVVEKIQNVIDEIKQGFATTEDVESF